MWNCSFAAHKVAQRLKETAMDNLSELYDALSKAQSEFPVIEKGSINPHFKSRYADLADINKAITPILSRHGLCVMQIIIPAEGKARIKTVLCHKSGASVDSTVELVPTQHTPQGMGSAYTYARRYGLSALLNLAADEDDDGNGASNMDHVNQPVSSYQKQAKLKQAIDSGIAAGYKRCIEKWLNDNQIDVFVLTEQQAEKALANLISVRGTFKKDSEL